MPTDRSGEKEFLENLNQIVLENISNEQFGVSELADAIGMSRSNLLRKVKKYCNLSVSQYIRNIRLQHAKELLETTADTVSEIAYKVGFSSPSYFIKCFGDLYGYPPGEQGKVERQDTMYEPESKPKKIKFWLFGILPLVAVIVLLVVLKPWESDKQKELKSIAVLPFINDSNDSSNVYIINGLMESTLNNLQKIQDLRVISRTSVEKYRKQLKTTPEIAKELEVTYLIEGSGQKIGEQIRLNIQLIEAETDKHLWSKEYIKNTSDIFALQAEVAKNITEEIKVIVTPEEVGRIEKAPTDNLEAYDTFLKGYDLLQHPTEENVKKSIPYFHEAIKLDPKFARAYAAIAIAYYSLDKGKQDKQFADSINYFADQALFNDSKLPQSLIAKALFYMENQEYELAVPYFEKVLEVSPNNDLVLGFLIDLYVNYLPDTEKYLEYALRGLEIDLLATYDSTMASYSYLHIGNAFVQSGFVVEAEEYVHRSLEYMPDNLYTQYVIAYVNYAKNGSLQQLNRELLETFEKDKTRLDVMQEVAKSFYYLGDYEKAFTYYKKFVDLCDTYKLDIYNSENYKIAYVCQHMGETELADRFIKKFEDHAQNMSSIYKHYMLAIYYAYHNDNEKAIEHLSLFAREKSFQYWIVLFTPLDPVFEDVKKHSSFAKIFANMENNFQNYHRSLETKLKDKGLL